MKVVIVGGGASGVICAIKIKQNNPQINVTIIEQNERILKKILKTGNGKCNIMNRNIIPEFYNDFSLIEANKNINVYQEISLLGIVLKEMTLGRVYPYSEQAQTVCNVLIRTINRLNIDVITNAKVIEIKKENDFKIKYIVDDNLNYINSDKIVLACGSYAQEETNGYNLATSFGLSITKLSPGLVAFNTKEKTSHLSGIRIKCDAYVKDLKLNTMKVLNGEILFRDNGLSGILALDISRFVDVNDVIYLDLMKEYTKEEIVDFLSSDITANLEGIFPKMICKDIIDRVGINAVRIAETIKHYSFTILKKKDFKESQITLGGIKLNEIKSTFETKKIDGLYITGEMLNCDGASGGYNLYFAWLSGIVCANDIIQKY